MRVTNSMLTAQVILDPGRNPERFVRIEEQVASTRRINRPGDDPIGDDRCDSLAVSAEGCKQEAVDQASLAAAAPLIQPSLVQFLT